MTVKTCLPQDHPAQKSEVQQFVVNNVFYDGPFRFTNSDNYISKASWLNFQKFCKQNEMRMLSESDLMNIESSDTNASREFWEALKEKLIWVAEKNQGYA